MATLGNEHLTLLDLARRQDPDGSVSAIAELLSQDNEILEDMPYVEGNLTTGHRATIRTGLPTATWRKLNAGIPTSKSRTNQVDATCGMLEARGAVDKELARLNGNTASFRASENIAFLEAMNETMAETTFYGTAATPEEFVGLSEHYNSISGADSGENIINAGGIDNCSSIWLLGWSPQTIFGVYPKGTMAGIEHNDLGEGDEFDASNNRYRALMDHYIWRNGLMVRDWRYGVRIANIDVTALTNDTTNVQLVTFMTRALERIKSLNGVRPVFYMNRTLRAFLRTQAVAKVAGSTLAFDNIGGKPMLSFCEVPVKRCDKLNLDETVVS